MNGRYVGCPLKPLLFSGSRAEHRIFVELRGPLGVARTIRVEIVRRPTV